MSFHHHQHTRLWICLLICITLIAACRAEPTTAPPTEGPPTEPPATEAPSETEPTAAPPTATATPTETPAPTVTPEPTTTPEPTETPEPTATAEAPATEAPPTATPVPPEPAQPTATQTTGNRDEPAPPPPAETVAGTPALTIIPDADPAPPLTVLVSTNRELEENHYKISGLLRNDAGEPYTGLNVIVTFYLASGLHYGPVEANCAAPVLAPGEVCPFIAEATAKNMEGVMLHPEGYATGRVPAPVEISGIGRYTDGVGYVHLTGTVRNPNPYAVENTTLSGVLLDGGEIVSVGTDLIIEILPAGETTRFDIPVKGAAYTSVQVYAHAEQHLP